MKKFAFYLLLGVFSMLFIWAISWTTFAQQQDKTNEQPSSSSECKWIKLNTDFPIIWNCIWDKAGEDSTNAFPTMLWAITKIIMSVILVVCLIMIIVAGILWAADNPKAARPILKKVAITILLLWLSWVILKLVNPNFFV